VPVHRVGDFVGWLLHHPAARIVMELGRMQPLAGLPHLRV
jgi:hypothetical protein